MEWNTEFIIAALCEIAKAIMNKVTNTIQRKIDQREIEKYGTDNIYSDSKTEMKRYIIFSMGGMNNVAFIKPYQDTGYMLVFYDFGKVKYHNFKNLGFRVWISEERGSVILKPRVSSAYIETDSFWDSFE